MTCQTWETTRPAKIGAWAIGAVFILIGAGMAVARVSSQTTPPVVSVFGAVLAASGVCAPWLLAVRPRIMLTDADLTVINPLGRVTIPLASIRRVRSGYSGLSVEYDERGTSKTVVAWAVQKSNAARWLHKRVRSDEVAEVIGTAVQAETSRAG